MPDPAQPDPRPPAGPRTIAAADPDDPVATRGTAVDSSTSEPGAPPAPGVPVGDRLGGYRIVRELGRGGMGVVYEAEDEQLGRRVALKVMAPTLAGNETARKRFLREARSMATVEHDHVVPVYGIGEDAGRPFIAMPLLAGQTLDGLMAGGRAVEIPLAVDIARQVATALAAAHAKGLVHRDVKPSNVWLEANPDGSFKRVRLLDFGLTRAVSGDAQVTASNQLVGTPAYMAPEQAAGAAVDHRADLFSLGCVLYRMLVGRQPFLGESAIAVLHALATTAPKPPAALNPAVSAPLSDLTMRLLAKVVVDRPGSADAVAGELAPHARRAESPGPKPVNPVPPASPARPPDQADEDFKRFVQRFFTEPHKPPEEAPILLQIAHEPAGPARRPPAHGAPRPQAARPRGSGVWIWWVLIVLVIALPLAVVVFVGARWPFD